MTPRTRGTTPPSAAHTIGDLAEAARRSGDPQGIGVFLHEMETAAGQTSSPSLHAGLGYARAVLATGADAGTLFGAALNSSISGARSCGPGCSLPLESGFISRGRTQLRSRAAARRL
jgi:hypothetical protein